MALADDLAALRTALERVHGLAGTSDIARAWGISKQRVQVLSTHQDFPEPIVRLGGRPIWTRAEADAWRKRQLDT